MVVRERIMMSFLNSLKFVIPDAFLVLCSRYLELKRKLVCFLYFKLDFLSAEV